MPKMYKYPSLECVNNQHLAILATGCFIVRPRIETQLNIFCPIITTYQCLRVHVNNATAQTLQALHAGKQVAQVPTEKIGMPADLLDDFQMSTSLTYNTPELND